MNRNWPTRCALAGTGGIRGEQGSRRVARTEAVQRPSVGKPTASGIAQDVASGAIRFHATRSEQPDATPERSVELLVTDIQRPALAVGECEVHGISPNERHRHIAGRVVQRRNPVHGVRAVSRRHHVQAYRNSARSLARSAERQARSCGSRWRLRAWRSTGRITAVAIAKAIRYEWTGRLMWCRLHMLPFD
jgi:hypothetical protein